MNLRSFFNQQHFWGKVLGAFFGYLIAGPAGALFGILIGNLFDKGVSLHYNRPYWGVYQYRNSTLQTQFLQTTFVMLGYLAKIDGRVSEKSIVYANQLINDLRLNATQSKEARQAFRTGKDANFDFTKTLISFKQLTQLHPELRFTFLNILYQATQVDGATAFRVRALNKIFETMGYAPLEQQFRFRQDYSFHYNKHHYQQSHSAPHFKSSLSEAYEIIGVATNANQSTVKKAYRRLMSQHHPDKLMSKGKNEADMKRANEKTQQISRAYEMICKDRGWN